MEQRTRGWVIGRAAGAPVIITPSSLVFALVLAALFAPTVRLRAPDLGASTYAVALVFAVLLLASVLVHELAHGFVARARGLQVREFALTFVGGHTQFTSSAATPATSALVAFVGPAANLVLGGIFQIAAGAAPVGSLTATVLDATAFANWTVGLFNLVPGLPLDGGRVLEALVWGVSRDRPRGTIAAAWCGRVVALAVVGWAIVLPMLRGSSPSLTFVVWAALVGAVLWSGAGDALRSARIDRRLVGLTVAALGRPATTVPAAVSLADADAARGRAGVDEVVLVAPDGRPVAYVDRAASGAVPPAARAGTPVSAVAVGLLPGAVIQDTLAGVDLVRAVAPVGSGAVVAVRLGLVRCLVTGPDVAAALSASAPAGGGPGRSRAS